MYVCVCVNACVCVCVGGWVRVLLACNMSVCASLTLRPSLPHSLLCAGRRSCVCARASFLSLSLSLSLYYTHIHTHIISVFASKSLFSSSREDKLIVSANTRYRRQGLYTKTHTNTHKQTLIYMQSYAHTRTHKHKHICTPPAAGLPRLAQTDRRIAAKSRPFTRVQRPRLLENTRDPPTETRC